MYHKILSTQTFQ